MAESTNIDLTCQQVTALLIDYVTDELDPAITQALQEHLRHCRDCVAFLRTYTETIRATRSLRYEDVPAEMVDRLQAFLHARIAKIPHPS
jgi:anti-sigma factor RsiW